MNIGQWERPEFEKKLPLWQIEALDRQRAEFARNAGENPAIWQKLNELENKLDRIFALLISQNPPRLTMGEQEERSRI